MKIIRLLGVKVAEGSLTLGTTPTCKILLQMNNYKRHAV